MKTKIDRRLIGHCKTCGRWKQSKADETSGICLVDGGICGYKWTCVGWIDRVLYEMMKSVEPEGK